MLKDFFSLLFPRVCILTKMPLAKGEKYISTLGASQLPKHDLNLLNENLHERFYGLVTIKHAFAYYKFSKNGKVQKLLHHLKYGRCPEVGELAARWYANGLLDAGYDQSFDIVIPVPLHKEKQRRRGYNQCDSIAKGMAEILGIPWSNAVLVKEKNTQSQTKKNRMARFTSADSVYKVCNGGLIKDKKVLVVDDIITTGATIGSCSQLLLQSGCKEVSVAALASAE